MCGIAGIVTRDGSPPSEEILRSMAEAVAHRGPDGDGIWIVPGIGLAHRRLAIIDLSPNAAQPMHDLSGNFTIVFNGEIYNYCDLRRELEAKGAQCRTHSDTEVILEAYRAWGVNAFLRLHGMFALGLWDAHERRLLLVRDRIGKKPLFYAMTPDGHLAFASEIKALAPITSLAPDWQAIRLFFGLQYVPSPLTGFEGVKQLLPGEVGMFDEKGWRTEKYHEWEVGSRKSKGESQIESYDEHIRFLLHNAVKLRLLASDVPVGAFLSGGIDSAAIVACAATHLERPLQTFTMGFPSLHMDERREAREIAEQFGTDHSEFVAQPEHLAVLLDDLVAQYDAPYADSSALPLWLLARETAKEIKVVLTGDGGDELFGGYRRYRAYEKAIAFAKIPFVSLASGVVCCASFAAPNWRRFLETVSAARRDPCRAYGELFCGSYFATSRLHEIFHPEFLRETETADAVDFITERTSLVERRTSPLEAAMHFDLTSYLPDDLNVKMDRATMRFGLEARCPFLDQELVAYALALPLREKINHGKKKIALRRAFFGVLSDAVLYRKKRGFQVPLADWFRGQLGFLLRERLLDPSLPIARVIRRDAIERLIRENAHGRDHGNRLWMLLTFSTWLEKHS